jgi:transcription termination factor Rho
VTNTEIPGVSETLDAPTAASSDTAATSNTSTARQRRRGTGLDGMVLAELQQLAGGLGIKGTGRLRKSQLIDAIKAAQSGDANAASGNQSQSKDAASDPPQDTTRGRRRRAERVQAAPETQNDAPAQETVAEQAQSAASDGDEARRGGQDRNRQSRQKSADNNDRRRGGNEGRNDSQQGDASQHDAGQHEADQHGEGQADSQQNRQQRPGGAGGENFDDDRGGNRNRRRRRDRRGGGGGGGSRERRPREQEPEVREDDVLIPVAGILDILDNYAFVRTSGYSSGSDDVYVSLAMVRRNGLRKGDAVAGAVRQPREGEKQQKFNAMVRVDSVNGADPEVAKKRPDFSKLTPLYPQDRLRLETDASEISTRIIDLFSPIGKGQRGLIVSPPKAGKTMIMQAIAHAITENNPEVHLMVVLVDERPEEVTDFQRSVKGEVIASTFDRPPSDHTALAELAIERAKRLVELGHDVVILLDGITRLGRAYNLAAPASGRILSGGVDSSALYPPKKFFGAARNIEDGGSLTILATALVETGSKMDEVIFEEFKGTGNMELRLRRDLADKRIYPAIDVDATSTRREEILVSKEELAVMWKLRRVISALDSQASLELMLDRLKKSKSNAEFLMQVQQSTPTMGGSSDND